jgi:hypothetical protein
MRCLLWPRSCKDRPGLQAGGVRAGVPGLGQELADVADALVDRFRADAEQDSDGDLGQREALVQDGGQEPVGQGEDGAAAGAGAVSRGRWPRRLSRLVFALLAVEGHQGGDQGVPVLGRQASQRWMVQPGQVGAGPVKRIGGTGDLVVCLGRRV